MHRSEWNDDDEALLIQLRKFDRVPVPLIAPLLARSKGAVYAHCAKLDARVMQRRVWSDVDIARLRRLFAEGQTDAAIARAMERSIGSVRWKLNDLDLHRHEASGRWNDADTATAERMLGESSTPAMIGRAVNRSASSVKAKLVKLGHVFESDAWSEETDGRLVAGIAASESPEVIGQAIGRTVDAVRARARKRVFV